MRSDTRELAWILSDLTSARNPNREKDVAEIRAFLGKKIAKMPSEKIGKNYLKLK